jgi:hypothetical protein
MTWNELQRLVNKKGIENILFMVPMRPIQTIAYISFKSSNNKEVMVPCKINEERYNVNDGYKITLECIYSKYGKEHFYQSDLVLLIEKGIIEVFYKKSVFEMANMDYLDL